VLEIQLPLLLGNASLKQAYKAMHAMGRSGVLLSVSGKKRLIHFDAIQVAHQRGQKKLIQVRDFENVIRVPRPKYRASPDLLAKYLDFRGASYLWTRNLGRVGEIVSRHEGLGTRYLLAPGIRHCSGPRHHSIPPNGECNGTCCLDGYPIGS
jgi:hypothetical protein